MMIAPRQKSGTRGRTKSGCMKMIVAESVLCEALTSRHIDAAAEGARNSETHIVKQNNDNVRSSFGRTEHRLLRSRSISCIERDRPAIWFVRNWNDFTAYFYILCHSLSPFFTAVPLLTGIALQRRSCDQHLWQQHRYRFVPN